MSEHIRLAQRTVEEWPEWKRQVFEPGQARDLDADLAICEAATPGPWIIDQIPNQIRQPKCSNRRRVTTPPDANGIIDAEFIAEARSGWPYAIRRAQEAEREADKLREENAMLLEQIQQHRSRPHSDSHCYD